MKSKYKTSLLKGNTLIRVPDVSEAESMILEKVFYRNGWNVFTTKETGVFEIDELCKEDLEPLTEHEKDDEDDIGYPPKR